MDTLVHADLRGVHSHGMLRLPVYLESVEAGGTVVGAPMKWVRELPAVAVLDAAFGFGQTAMARAVDRAADMATAVGCATVGVIQSMHFGAGSMWGMQLADRGLVSMILANSGLCMAPYGAAERVLGANPVTICAPGADGDHMVLDMATSVTAYGSIMAAARNRESIPPEWAVDRDGNPTTDPRAAMKGALQPFGGYKGSGLAVMVEVLAAALPGALFSYEIVDMLIDRSSKMGTGHLLVVLDPAAFGEADAFTHRTRELGERVTNARPAPGSGGALLPGQRERDVARQRMTNGITLPAGILDTLNEMASRLGVAPL